MKECPSCGNTVSDDQIVCPMCGTMLRFQGSNVKTANRELESMLFTCNSKAEVTLSNKLSAGKT